MTDTPVYYRIEGLPERYATLKEATAYLATRKLKDRTIHGYTIWHKKIPATPPPIPYLGMTGMQSKTRP